MLLPDHVIEAMSSPNLPDPLIEPYHASQLQPASYDLTLEQQFLFPGTNEVPFAATEIVVVPGKMVLACTQERIWLPRGIAGEISGKSGNARRGLQIEAAGHVDPGYCGVITLEISNRTDSPVMIRRGMGIAKIVFHRLESDCRTPYSRERNTHQYSHGPRSS